MQAVHAVVLWPLARGPAVVVLMPLVVGPSVPGKACTKTMISVGVCLGPRAIGLTRWASTICIIRVLEGSRIDALRTAWGCRMPSASGTCLQASWPAAARRPGIYAQPSDALPHPDAGVAHQLGLLHDGASASCILRAGAMASCICHASLYGWHLRAQLSQRATPSEAWKSFISISISM